MKITCSVLLMLLLALAPFDASAQYFKCQAEDGRLLFQDTPCKDDEKQQRLDLKDGVLGQCRGDRFSGVFVSGYYPEGGSFVDFQDRSGNQTTLYFSDESEIEVDEGYYEGFANEERVIVEGHSQLVSVLTCITRHELDAEPFRAPVVAGN